MIFSIPHDIMLIVCFWSLGGVSQIFRNSGRSKFICAGKGDFKNSRGVCLQQDVKQFKGDATPNLVRHARL